MFLAAVLCFAWISLAAQNSPNPAPSSNSNSNQSGLLTLENGPDAAPETRIDLGIAASLIKQKQFAKADDVLSKYLSDHPASGYGYSLLGAVKYEENQPAASLKAFTNSAKYQVPKASELVIVSLDYVKLRDMKNADKWMTLAAQKAPQNPAVWRYLGGIKYSENQFLEAVKAYQECLKLHPKDVLAEDGLGRSYAGMNRNDQAAAAYRTALEWQKASGSKYPQPLLHLGTLLNDQGKAQDALPFLTSAEQLDPGDPDVKEQLGQAYSQLNQADRARSELEQAIVLEPKKPSLHFMLAGVYQKLGLKDKADAERRLYSTLKQSQAGAN